MPHPLVKENSSCTTFKNPKQRITKNKITKSKRTLFLLPFSYSKRGRRRQQEAMGNIIISIVWFFIMVSLLLLCVYSFV